MRKLKMRKPIKRDEIDNLLRADAEKAKKIPIKN